MEWNYAMHQFCYQHSIDLATGIIKDEEKNQGFDQRVERIKAVLGNTKAYAENIGKSSEESMSKAVDVIFAQWLENDQYRSNIEGDFTLSSAAAYLSSEGDNYIVQLFTQI